jgi:O-antigen ligase
LQNQFGAFDNRQSSIRNPQSAIRDPQYEGTRMTRAPLGTAATTEWWRPVPPGHAQALDERTAVGARDSEVPFRALMTFTFILVLAPQSFIPALGPLRIAFLAGLVAIGAQVFGRIGAGRPVMTHTPATSIAACLLVWVILTIPWSFWPGGSVAYLSGVYFKTLVVFWLLGQVVTTLPRLRTIAWGLTLMSGPLAITAIKNFLSGAFTPGARVTRIIGYDAGLALNPNDLALILNLILPLALALALSTRRLAARAIPAGLAALAALAVILTFSRGGFVTLAAIFAMYLWKLRGRPEAPWAWAALVVALASVPLLPSGYSDRVTTILDVDSDPTGSSQARWRDTQAAVRFVARNPLIGAGVGQNTLALNEERGNAWLEVHNVYLEYAVDLGLPGLALFLLLFVESVKSTSAAQRDSGGASGGGQLFYLAEGIQISLLAFAVSALFHPAAYQFGFYYFAGLAVAARTIGEAGA